MNAEIGTEAAQFPGKEFINGILLQCYRLIKNVSFRFYSTVSVKKCSKMCVDLPVTTKRESAYTVPTL